MTATIQESAAPPLASQAPRSVPVSGIVDIADGHAFVRTSGYRPISGSQDCGWRSYSSAAGYSLGPLWRKPLELHCTQ